MFPSTPEKRVQEKLVSQWMTLSNQLGIKLMTTKTFPALKPIYTLVWVSLMSALKSTTNSPRRKSRAHRGCSGCLILCVLAGVCVYKQVPTHTCVGACGRERARTCTVSLWYSLWWRTHFLHLVLCSSRRPPFVWLFISCHTCDVLQDFSP